MKKSSGLPPDRVSDVLSKASGSAVTMVMISADIAAGAPIEPDGSINLIRYAAWLLKQGRDGGD